MKGFCERCGNYSELIEVNYIDEFGDHRMKKICDDCDWEISNGRGDFDDDWWEIQEDRREEEYEYDPVNNAPPY